MRYILALLFLAITTSSCTVYEKLRETAEKANEIVVAANETVAVAHEAVAEAKSQWAAHKAAADTDRDGTLTMDEILAYLAILLTGGGILVRNGKSNERKARIEAQVDALNKRVSTIP